MGAYIASSTLRELGVPFWPYSVCALALTVVLFLLCLNRAWVRSLDR